MDAIRSGRADKECVALPGHLPFFFNKLARILLGRVCHFERHLLGLYLSASVNRYATKTRQHYSVFKEQLIRARGSCRLRSAARTGRRFEGEDRLRTGSEGQLRLLQALLPTYSTRFSTTEAFDASGRKSRNGTAVQK
jgi:hypothetical protein